MTPTHGARSRTVQRGSEHRRRWAALLATWGAAAAVTGCPASGADDPAALPPGVEYVDIASVAPAPAPAGAGESAWQVRCGRNQEGHRNADNVVLQPGTPHGAHHTHDYVGNVSTDAFSTDASLAAEATTCDQDDRSAYYWPVLRLTDQVGADEEAPGGGADGNHGRIVTADSVLVQYRGSPAGEVVAPPRFLRAVTGNPAAVTRGGEHAEHVTWTCSGERGRVTTRYPRCGDGQQVVRVFDFPSCWDGRSTDSPGHRGHLTFPDAAGACPVGRFPVPRLHLEVAYSLAPDAPYAIDSFPSQHHSPVTDHAMVIGVVPDALMARIVGCLNRRSSC